MNVQLNGNIFWIGLVRGLQSDREGRQGGEREMVAEHPVADDRR